MSTRLQKYLMIDGRTRLGATYFNAVWADIDHRIDVLEGLRQALTLAVDQLTELGLTRINSLLLPAIENAQNDVAALIDNTNADITAAQNAVNALQAQFDALDVQGALDNALAGVNLPSLTKPSDSVFSYDSGGRITQIIEQTPLGERKTTYEYNAAGLVTQSVIEQGGLRRTEGYNYTGEGKLTAASATEEAIL